MKTTNPSVIFGQMEDRDSNDRYLVSFKTREEMAAAAIRLLACHPHHFQVLPDYQMSPNTLAQLTPMAVDCLFMEGLVSNGVLETVRKVHAQHLARALESDVRS